MIPYGRQEITEADIAAVEEVLRSDFLTQGPMVPRFEKALATYCHVSHAIAVNSATSALHIACLALGLGPGDWLWTSPNSFVASANCARYCGANVDFVDIDSRTYNMSTSALTEKLKQAESNGRLPKVVIPVHFAGQPADMPAIHSLSQQYGFKIIEDASHAIGASYRNIPWSPTIIACSRENALLERNDDIKVGSCTHSDVTVFSFHPVKIITAGEGGAAVTNIDEVACRMRRLRTHGIASDVALIKARPASEIWNYQQIELGYNYRLTDLQAAIGMSQLGRLDEYVMRRHGIARRYDAELANLPITTPWQYPGSYSSYHLYPIRISVRRAKKTQREIYDALLTGGIAANLHYIPVHRQPYYESLGFREGDFPQAEEFHREVISLPMFPTLTMPQQGHVIDLLQSELSL